MTLVPYTDRAAFWRYQSASITFEMVSDTAEYLIANRLPTSHQIHDPLVTAIYALYGRPFKQKAPLRLELAFVPAEHRGTHDALITLRDKMFAHTDLNGPETVDGSLLNELAGFTTNAFTKFGFTVVTPILPTVVELSTDLSQRARTEAETIWSRYMSRQRVPDGTTIVNLSPDDGPFLIPHPRIA